MRVECTMRFKDIPFIVASTCELLIHEQPNTLGGMYKLPRWAVWIGLKGGHILLVPAAMKILRRLAEDNGQVGDVLWIERRLINKSESPPLMDWQLQKLTHADGSRLFTKAGHLYTQHYAVAWDKLEQEEQADEFVAF